MKLGAKVRVPGAVCPTCKKVVDGASAADGVKATPKQGDLSICIYCAGVAQYDASLQLHAFDVQQLPADERALIEQHRRLVRLANAKG